MKRIKVFIYMLGCYATLIFIFGGLFRFETISEEVRQDGNDAVLTAFKSENYHQRHLAESKIVEADVTDLTAGECLPRQSQWCQELSERHKRSHTFEFENLTKKTCNLTEYLQQCDRFKTAYGYTNFPVAHDEKMFPLAYSLMIYENAAQMEQVLRNIYRPHNIHCIHVDEKADPDVFTTATSIARCLDNVIVIHDRETMVHSSFTYVSAELKCMGAVLNSTVQWKYYINIAGDEFPLRTNLEMVRILNLFKGANDVESYNHPAFLTWKLQHTYSVFGNSLAEEGQKSKFKYNLKISRGNPKGTFSREFVNFIMNDNIANELLTWFRDAYDPADNVWATLVTLPWAPGNYPVEVRHLIHTFASRAFIHTEDSEKCQGRLIRNMCYLGKGDIPWLLSRPELIAGKFDVGHDPEVVNCLEHHIRQRAMTSEVFSVDWKFFVNLPHVKYHWNHNLLRMNHEQLEEIKQKWINDHSL